MLISKASKPVIRELSPGVSRIRKRSIISRTHRDRELTILAAE